MISGFVFDLIVFLLMIILVIFLRLGRLNMVFSRIFFMIDCRLCVLVLCLMVWFVIVISVLLVNVSCVFLILNSFWYCLISVFFGWVRIVISVFVFRLVNVVIIGRWLINLGIRLNFSRFLGFNLVKSLLILWLLFLCILVLKFIVVFLLCWVMILFRLVNVLL